MERRWIGANRLKNLIMFVITDWIINSSEHTDEILEDNYLDSLISMRKNVEQMNEIAKWVTKNWGYIKDPNNILSQSIYDKIKDGVTICYNNHYSDMPINNYEAIFEKKYEDKRKAEEDEYKSKF